MGYIKYACSYFKENISNQIIHVFQFPNEVKYL